ncbi:hypothetical protein Tco_0425572 [Tanacetum coccineum]
MDCWVLMTEVVVAKVEEVVPCREEVAVVEKISSTGSKLIANGEDCLDGCDGAGRGEVNGGDKFWLGGEAGRGLTKQQARTLIQAVLLKALALFLSLFVFVMVNVSKIL